MATLADILSPAQMYSPENIKKMGYQFMAQQGQQGTSNDGEGPYRPEGWYKEVLAGGGGDDGSWTEYQPFDRQFQTREQGDSGGGDNWVGSYEDQWGNQLNQAGYKALTPQERQRMETNMRNNGFTGTLEEAMAQAFPGSQVVDDPNHGSLLQYGPGGAAGGNNAMFGNFLDNDGWMMKAAPYLIGGLATAGLGGFLPGTTSVFGGGAAAGGAGAAGGAAGAGGTPWYAGLTDMAGGSLLNPGAAGSAYAGLGGAAAGAGGLGALQGAAPVTEMGQAAGAADIARIGASGGMGGASSLANILSNGGNTQDWMKTLGTVGSTALGVYGANEQANAYSDTADKYMALGAPSRARLEASYQPGFTMQNEPGYQDAMKTGMDTYMRAASAGRAGGSSGNPFDNPGVSTEAMKYITGSLALPQLNTYRSQLGTFGQLGTNQAGTADLTNAGNSGQGLNAIGYGLNQVVNPQPSLANMMKQLNMVGF